MRNEQRAFGFTCTALGFGLGAFFAAVFPWWAPLTLGLVYLLMAVAATAYWIGTES